MPLAENDPLFNGVARVTDLWYRLLRLRKIFIRTYLKNVFWLKSRVGLSFQVLKIQKYSCGLKLGPALTLNQNLIFEMASINIAQKRYSHADDFYIHIHHV